jgi:hypothetical protein
MFKLILKKFFFIKIWKSTFLNHSDNLEISIEKNLIDNLSNKFIYVADPFTINGVVYFEGLSIYFRKGQLFSLKNREIKKILFSTDFLNKHMSFPFVFNHKRSTFLLPQISNINKLVLFKLDENSAKEYKTLLTNNEYRDSVIFKHNSNFIVFTTQKKKNKSNFKAFRFDSKFNLINEFTLLNYNKQFRCAGSVFLKNNELIIPIQNSQPIYGSGVNLYKFSINNNEITFDLHKEIKVLNSSNQITGFHTYNKLDEDKVLIDYRIEKFNLFTIFYKLKFYFDQYL